ncbi:alpha-amylase family glycosyl hydrolase [Aliikangiella coralliicola]|uniref:Alpha-glucosidase n=1 Tax=Aliikangiella coralliicola TaxID=2592383 RepID=A0A545UJP0_9GAMM|nr:alpha-amylase family glycosyl hydrolase [Aliikangiella coralliicola]TQV89677.1 alpha-glucosidase [Aliikangiella coralliicola]
MSQTSWWRGAVIYQIYPRSLKDSNGDGVGDLQGIVQQLDYIASLGVDAIWVSPFFKSPMKDFGYDISDYQDVDPLFGTLEDFDQLIAKAHDLGLKVIIDQVLSHTSDQHAWFIESRDNKTNSKADWYVWADAKEDGSAPNNWLSIFGGCAWQWEPRRQQYYLHNFLTSQPDLNFHNPDVQQAILENVEFWLKRKVDGFRLDAINFCYHDKMLRDNPAKPVNERQGRGFSEDNPYAYQYHYYNNTQPENIAFIEKLRALLDQYPGTTTLGEISSEDSLATMAEYTEGGKRLHMGYSFELLTDDFSAQYIRQTVESLESKMTEGWPCWAISNHDVKRVVSRWGDKENSEAKAKLFSALLGSLRGSICSYQGEELGLEEAELTFEQLQDPYGITFWPTFKGRDGCRTPMPWNSHLPHAGFSENDSWLPIPVSHIDKAINLQEDDPLSVLNSFRQFFAWRKNYPSLITGNINFIDTEEPVLGFFRENSDEKLLVYFNLSSSQQVIPINQEYVLSSVEGHGLSSGAISGNQVVLPAYGCLFAKCK